MRLSGLLKGTWTKTHTLARTHTSSIAKQHIGYWQTGWQAARLVFISFRLTLLLFFFLLSHLCILFFSFSGFRKMRSRVDKMECAAGLLGWLAGWLTGAGLCTLWRKMSLTCQNPIERQSIFNEWHSVWMIQWSEGRNSFCLISYSNWIPLQQSSRTVKLSLGFRFFTYHKHRHRPPFQLKSVL